MSKNNTKDVSVWGWMGVEEKQGARESGEECLEIAKNIFKELDFDVPDSVFDRAHCIGKTTERDGKRFRQVFVRFTTWRNHTAVYRARKKVPEI